MTCTLLALDADAGIRTGKSPFSGTNNTEIASVPSVKSLPVMVSESNGFAVVSLSELIWTGTVVIVRDEEPFTEPEAALIVAVPVATPLATPALLTVATAGLDDDHVAVLVRSCVLLSLKVPVAVNCCELPTLTDGLAGVTSIETRLGVDEPWLPPPELPPPHATKEISRNAAASPRRRCKTASVRKSLIKRAPSTNLKKT
jgi:hypothetical protein